MNKRIFLTFLLVLFVATSAFAILDSGNIKIFAVTEDERGISADLFLYALSGGGQVAFITSNSLVAKDTQTTGNIAIDVAREKANVSTTNNNFIFDIKANASEVDGPSAGASMALLSYSVLSERKLNPQVAVTGTINSDGSIGLVGKVYHKAVAASKIGIKLFMIPRGVANQVERIDGKVKSINLLSYGPEELDMKIIEVDTIDDVINYAYANIESIEVDAENAIVGFVPEAINYDRKLEGMEEISKTYITRAESVVEDAKKELEVTELDEVFRSSFYPQLSIAERNIELSQIYLDQNYLYSAANYSFNARVLSGAILEVAENPSLLSKESKVLDIKISALKSEIKALKNKMDFISVNNYEWLIGAQQRIAYAENAIINAENARNSLGDYNDVVDESAAMFNIVYELSSAKAWVEVGGDFYNEAKKDTVKKIPYYSDPFKKEVNDLIKEIDELINNSNLNDSSLEEPIRRLNSAKISVDNNFYFAAIYDAYFSRAFIFSDLTKEGKSVDELKEITQKSFDSKDNISSIWGILFIDHSFFFTKNAEYQRSAGKENSYELNIRTSYDLAELAKDIEEAKFEVDKYLALTSFEDYIETETGNASVGITYNETDVFVFSPVILALIIVLLLILVVVIIVGFNSARNPFISDASRAKKLDLLLHRLDKALSKKKISNAEYFFLKKKYEDEFNVVSTARQERSKIALNLDESRAKLRALVQGKKDLKKHYNAGLIIPEDYERHILEVNSEIEDVKKKILEYDEELRNSRRGKNRRVIGVEKKSSKLKGTEEQVEEEKLEEKEDKNKRKKLIEKFKSTKKKK